MITRRLKKYRASSAQISAVLHECIVPILHEMGAIAAEKSFNEHREYQHPARIEKDEREAYK